MICKFEKIILENVGILRDNGRIIEVEYSQIIIILYIFSAEGRTSRLEGSFGTFQ